MYDYTRCGVGGETDLRSNSSNRTRWRKKRSKMIAYMCICMYMRYSAYTHRQTYVRTLKELVFNTLARTTFCSVFFLSSPPSLFLNLYFFNLYLSFEKAYIFIALCIYILWVLVEYMYDFPILTIHIFHYHQQSFYDDGADDYDDDYNCNWLVLKVHILHFWIEK